MCRCGSHTRLVVETVDDPGYLPSLKPVKGHQLSAIIADGTFPAARDNSFAALYYKLGMCKDDEVCCFTAGQMLGAVDGKTEGRPNTAVHLVDASATGKTRTLYEGLAKRSGMLLVCATGDEYMRMTDVVTGLAQAPEKPDARALHFAKVVASALLARFVVLRHMLKQLGRDAFTPSDWLRTQLRGDVGAGAMLQALSLKLQGSRFSFSFLVGRLVLEALHVTRQAHGTNTVAMPIVIDEAQQLCKLPNVAHLQEVIMQAGEDATSRWKFSPRSFIGTWSFHSGAGSCPSYAGLASTCLIRTSTMGAHVPAWRSRVLGLLHTYCNHFPGSRLSQLSRSVSRHSGLGQSWT